MGACIFDCGLFDGVKRLHHKPLVYDEFCGTLTVYRACVAMLSAMQVVNRVVLGFGMDNMAQMVGSHQFPTAVERFRRCTLRS